MSEVFGDHQVCGERPPTKLRQCRSIVGTNGPKREALRDIASVFEGCLEPSGSEKLLSGAKPVVTLFPIR